MLTGTPYVPHPSPSALAAAALLALALGLAGCGQKTPPAAAQPPAEAKPAQTANPAPVAAQPVSLASPTDTVKAFLTDYLGDTTVSLKAAKPLPGRHQPHPQEGYRVGWTAGRQPAGSGTVELDQTSGLVSLAILRWTKAGKQAVTNEQLRAIAVERLRHWVGPGVEDAQVTATPLHTKAYVAFLWDGRAGDHYSGERAHVVLSTHNGLPVSFDQYRVPATAIAPKLTQAQAIKAATAALSPVPKAFRQTGTEARLYDHSPLAKGEGPVWAVAVTGTMGKDNQKSQAGAVIDAVSGELLAPKRKAAAKPAAGHTT